jgi:hypothetical protein
MSHYGTTSFYTCWLASATNAYRDHPLYGALVRQSVAACGGTVRRPTLSLTEGAGR